MMKYKISIALILTVCTAIGQQLPIKSSRTLKIHTDEGTSMSVDISPDGKLLAFDLLGDIYTVPSTGGKATQFTKGLAFNYKPVWSPDGENLAFFSDETGELGIVSKKFKPNKTRVATSGSEKIEFDRRIIWKNQGEISVSKPNPRNTTSSIDNKFLCRVENNTLVVKDLTTGDERVLVKDLGKSRSIYDQFLIQQYVFAPDSKSIYISYGGKIHQVSTTGDYDRIIPIDIRAEVKMGKLNDNRTALKSGNFPIRYIRSASLTPDNGKLIFSALNKIYIQKFPKGNPEVLYSQSCSQYQPCISADGKEITYVSWDDEQGGFVWKVPLTGGSPVKLTNESGQYQRPVWDPNGAQIAVVKGDPTFGDRDDPGNGKLITIDVRTGAVKILDGNVPLWNSLSYSEDGTTLYYSRYNTNEQEPKQWELVAANSKTLDRKIIVTIPESTLMMRSSQRLLSPNGKYLACSFGEEIFVAPLTDLKNWSQNFADLSKWTKLGPGIDPVWKDGGKTLCWTFANKFYKEDLSELSGNKHKSVQPFDISVQASPASGNGLLALTNARIITIKGNEVIERGTILIKDDRIIAVGNLERIKIPKEAKSIDLEGKTIIPGFIDLHLHSRLPENIFPQQNWMYQMSLAYGITTGRDPSSTYDSFGYAELLRTGQVSGPRQISVGRSINPNFGYNIPDFSTALSIVSKRQEMGGVSIKQYQLPNRFQRQLLLQASDKLGLNMTNEGPKLPLQVVPMIKDGSSGIEHNQEWGGLYKDFLMLMAKSVTYLTPTLQVCYGEENALPYFNHKFWSIPSPKMLRFMPKDHEHTLLKGTGHENIETVITAKPIDTINPIYKHFATIYHNILLAGGKVAVGSHGNNPGIGFHSEMWALSMGGFTNMETLKAATLIGAEALGLQKDLGSIENDKIADLIILNKNPLEDIHHTREIKYVIKDGIIYDGNTLQKIELKQISKDKDI